MPHLRNIFREYNDPRVYKNMRLGFLALIVCGVLIAFIASPTLRHHIGIGDAEPVQRPTPHKIEHRHKHHQGPVHKKAHGQQHHSGQENHVRGHSHPSTSHHTNKGSGGSKKPPKGSGGGHPTSPNPTTPSPGSPPSPQPSNPAPSNPGNGSGSSGGGNGGGGTSGGKVGVEVEAPGIGVPPLVEEGAKGVNEAVNGVTNTVNETTSEAPAHVEVPETCLVKC